MLGLSSFVTNKCVSPFLRNYFIITEDKIILRNCKTCLFLLVFFIADHDEPKPFLFCYTENQQSSHQVELNCFVCYLQEEKVTVFKCIKFQVSLIVYREEYTDASVFAQLQSKIVQVCMSSWRPFMQNNLHYRKFRSQTFKL